MVTLLQGPSIAELAAQLASQAAPELPQAGAQAMPEPTRYPLSHSQESLWLLHRLAPDSSAYRHISAHRAAGAIVVTVFTVQASSAGTMEQAMGYLNYDVEVNMSLPVPVGWRPADLGDIPGVERVEGWGLQFGFRVRPDGSQSRTDITVIGPPADTDLIRPTLLEGRWLLPDDDRAVVINADMAHDEPDLQVGSRITLKLDGSESTWEVVGIATSQLQGTTAYVRDEALARAAEGKPTVARVVARTTVQTEEAQQAAANLLEERLREARLKVQQSSTGTALREGVDYLFSQLILFLMLMAVMLALVAGLGLAGTMSLNVLERTREIGVMRAIGASGWSIIGIVVGEGAVTGLISWVLGSLLAWPVSRLLSDTAGSQLVKAPLEYTPGRGSRLAGPGSVPGLGGQPLPSPERCPDAGS